MKFALLKRVTLIAALAYPWVVSAQEREAKLCELKTDYGQFPAIFFDWTEEGTFEKMVGPDYVHYTHEQSPTKFAAHATRTSIYIGSQPFGIQGAVTGKKFITEIMDFKTERAMWFKWSEKDSDGTVMHYSTVYLLNVFPAPASPPNLSPIIQVTLSGGSAPELRRLERLISSLRIKK